MSLFVGYYLEASKNQYQDCQARDLDAVNPCTICATEFLSHVFHRREQITAQSLDAVIDRAVEKFAKMLREHKPSKRSQEVLENLIQEKEGRCHNERDRAIFDAVREDYLSSLQFLARISDIIGVAGDLSTLTQSVSNLVSPLLWAKNAVLEDKEVPGFSFDMVYKQQEFQERLKRVDGDRLEDLQPNQGAVITGGGVTLSCYRDGDGEYYLFDSHGSTFSLNAHVIKFGGGDLKFIKAFITESMGIKNYECALVEKGDQSARIEAVGPYAPLIEFYLQLEEFNPEFEDVAAILDQIPQVEEVLPGFRELLLGGLWANIGQHHPDKGNPRWSEDHFAEYFNDARSLLAMQLPFLIEEVVKSKGQINIFDGLIFEEEKYRRGGVFNPPEHNWGKLHRTENLTNMLATLSRL